jgi:photosystem II stability/assembly factor-like uncharacterized protein
MMQRILLTLLLLGAIAVSPAWAQKKKKKNADDRGVAAVSEEKEKDPFNAGTFSGLKWRELGPATTSGRIADMAVNPNKPWEYYLAVACGGVWKTSNGGTTFEPIFDSQPSYSIGCISIDPNNDQTIWVGSGENNGQRSIAYGDGVYRSLDGGRSWKNMGLKESEHIGNIVIHPDNSDVIFVAAHGPLWSGGGDRGLYKSTDGGENWNKVLEVDEWTGVNEVHMDPSNPQVMYASTWQRARHVWTFLGGGPGSAIYKSTDGGETWNKSENGIPGGDKGRIALAVSPVNTSRIFALVEAGEGSGLYRSDNGGTNWNKVNSYITSGNYYQEIYCDPVDADKVFFMDTWAHVSTDGGNTVKKFGEEKYKHVDNHCMWIDPTNTDHILMGCDGGLYETWNWGEDWQYKPNLSITQFYKVSVDNEKPFYYVYGGTQDNNTLGGPSRTTNRHGIANSDWFITNGGDGFEAVVDPKDPNTVYAQSQYGFLNRFDKASGEKIGIKPMEGKGEPALRWNWDAPLIISPHQHTRLYFAANKLFRSDDRGNSWTAVSDDLTRQINRNELKIMGRQWGVDAINIHRSTTDYGNIVALDESPLKEGLLYVGTDDGLIQVSENGGESWNKVSFVTGVPETTYVNMLVASRHAADRVYAAFNNHKRGDFKPYVYRSNDHGQTWTSISANLPERGSVYCIAEDHEDPNLLFVGTEFGVFFTVDGGEKWTQLKNGLPTIAVRDMDIQRRENDLVIATFGRGFYVLDDYSPLRKVNKEALAKDAIIFPVKDALQFVQSSPLGYAGVGFQGKSYFTTPNPPVGAVFTYYLKEAPKTMKEERREKEKELKKEGKDIAWPSWEDLRKEDEEEGAELMFTVRDSEGKVVRRMSTKPSAGMHRVVWDFHFPPTSPVRLSSGGGYSPYASEDKGPRAKPGKYSVELDMLKEGKVTRLADPVSFNVIPLKNSTLPAKDAVAAEAFMKRLGELNRAISGANRLRGELNDKVNHMEKALELTPSAPLEMVADIQKLKDDLRNIGYALNGDPTKSRRQFSTPPSISGRVGTVEWTYSNTRSEPTKTMVDQLNIAEEEFAPVMTRIKTVVSAIEAMEKKMESIGAPYTPGRMPGWEKP